MGIIGKRILRNNWSNSASLIMNSSQNVSKNAKFNFVSSIHAGLCSFWHDVWYFFKYAMLLRFSPHEIFKKRGNTYTYRIHTYLLSTTYVLVVDRYIHIVCRYLHCIVARQAPWGFVGWAYVLHQSMTLTEKQMRKYFFFLFLFLKFKVIF